MRHLFARLSRFAPVVSLVGLSLLGVLYGVIANALWIEWLYDREPRMEWFVLPFLAGFFLVSRTYRHPYRSLGFAGVWILFGSCLFFLGLAYRWPVWLALTQGLALGTASGSLIRFQNYFMSDSRKVRLFSKWGVSFDRGLRIACLLVPLYFVLYGMQSFVSDRTTFVEFRSWCDVLGTIVYVLLLFLFPFVTFHAFFELLVETSLLWAYRVTAIGPGLTQMPRSGPVLVIANHACYIDPLFVAKMLPRRTTPLMTANFYDKPIIRQLMTYIFDTIRVNEVTIRREAPEIQEAIEALDAGKCVVIFPEGFLRRTDAMELRRFGRGVWQILHARPDTPVVACWIDGIWGSYFSFKDGPPTKGKKMDVRRRIRMAVREPFVVPREILDDHMAARVYLMNRVIDARDLLDLPPLPTVTVPHEKGDEPVAAD